MTHPSTNLKDLTHCLHFPWVLISSIVSFLLQVVSYQLFLFWFSPLPPIIFSFTTQSFLLPDFSDSTSYFSALFSFVAPCFPSLPYSIILAFPVLPPLPPTFVLYILSSNFFPSFSFPPVFLLQIVSSLLPFHYFPQFHFSATSFTILTLLHSFPFPFYFTISSSFSTSFPHFPFSALSFHSLLFSPTVSFQYYLTSFPHLPHSLPSLTVQYSPFCLIHLLPFSQFFFLVCPCLPLIPSSSPSSSFLTVIYSFVLFHFLFPPVILYISPSILAICFFSLLLCAWLINLCSFSFFYPSFFLIVVFLLYSLPSSVSSLSLSWPSFLGCLLLSSVPLFHFSPHHCLVSIWCPSGRRLISLKLLRKKHIFKKSTNSAHSN